MKSSWAIALLMASSAIFAVNYLLFSITRFSSDESAVAWFIFGLLPYIYYPFGALAFLLFFLAVLALGFGSRDYQ